MKISADDAIARACQTNIVQTHSLPAAKASDYTLKAVIDKDIFVFGTQHGYIITSSESDAHAVLCIGTERPFDTSAIPEPQHDIIDCYAQDIVDYRRDFVKKGQTILHAPQANTSGGRVTTNTLMKCGYGQAGPYWNNLDLVNSKTGEVQRCYTGCPATAIAQLVYYWGVQGIDKNVYRRGCMATPEYDSTRKGTDGKTYTYHIDPLPALPVFDYDHLPKYHTNNDTEAQKKAVATLMEYLGKASYTNYSPSASGTWFEYALTVIQNYVRLARGARIINADDRSTHAKNNYPNPIGFSAFEQLVYEDITAKRPVIMAAYTSAGTNGHAFVVDGYNKDKDMYHINMGYNTSGNDWYKLSSFTYNGVTRNACRIAIIDIDPRVTYGDINLDGLVNMSDVSAIINKMLDKDNRYFCDLNYDGVVDQQDINLLIDIILGK
jgi:hypothetical protein